ncbi:hypothetical protein G3M48_000776 [Beauveria asiatica]|uniref:DUF1479 domain protein n=1 Tax=Beauveria asiatica TaxID=1069075 RepID=A0AAW0S0U8_9HYPO
MASSPQLQIFDEPKSKVPMLDQRFAKLKKSFVKPEHKQHVIDSYQRLCSVLQDETDFIARNGPYMIPEIDFELVRKNGGSLPSDLADLIRDRGCVILRNVVEEEQAVKWEKELNEYTQLHPNVGGFPADNPQTWTLWWTPAQVQIRGHPRVLEAMNCVSKLWKVSDQTALIDLSSQAVYPDRFRIRYPSTDTPYIVPPHLDGGAIERWEDPVNRSNYAAIFEGNWQDWDGWVADKRINAKSDLYFNGSSCSCWRSLQGWLSLSHCNTGEGTLRLLPSLKASVAYTMLRPLFQYDIFDDTQPTFPGSTPGHFQFWPTDEFHPHLAMEISLVGIPPVKPGDYAFWHSDLIHEVDKFHPGKHNSSVVYNGCVPLTPYNIDSLVSARGAFRKVAVPRDFAESPHLKELEAEHEDHGAKLENIWSEQGMRAMGLLPLDVDEQGLTEGQREVRRLANTKLGFK